MHCQGHEVSPAPSPAPVPEEEVVVVPAGPQLGHPCLWAEVAEADPGFLMLLNADHVCVHVSTAGWAAMGGTSERIVGSRPEAALDPDQLPQVWRTRAAVAAGARDVPTRVRVRCGDDQERWFDTSSTLVRDPATGAEYTAVHGRDVTHEMELQAALTRSEQRHSRLLSSLEQAVIQLDASLRIESFNTEALALLARPPEHLLGRRVFAAVDLRDTDGRAITEAAHRAVQVPTGDRGEERWCTVGRGDGQRRLVRVSLSHYAGSRPEDGGHLMILQEAGRAGGPPNGAPSQQHARGAAGLTAREGDVLDGLAAGGDVPTIARRLGISVHSVRGHVKSITAKLGVHSQLQAVIAAARAGMIDLTEGPAGT